MSESERIPVLGILLLFASGYFAANADWIGVALTIGVAYLVRDIPHEEDRDGYLIWWPVIGAILGVGVAFLVTMLCICLYPVRTG